MLYIYSPRPSNGARELAEELDSREGSLRVRRLKQSGTKVLTSRDVVINWGSASPFPARIQRARIVNTPEAIAEVSNKLTFFGKMNDVRLNDRRVTPVHFTSTTEATEYLRRKGGSIVCRRVLNGSGGDGIVIADTDGQLVDCQLYTRYINKRDEFRIHIMAGRVIDQQRKARRLADDDVDWKIRNLANGFIYVRQDVNPPRCVIDVAKKCMENLSLDFGAVDVIYNAAQGRAFVLEVNSAPGLEGQTVVNYANGFREMLR